MVTMPRTGSGTVESKVLAVSETALTVIPPGTTATMVLAG